MRILALAIPLALTGLAAGLAGCSAGPDNRASMSSGGVGFGDYQRYLREREATRSSTPYSVPPESRAPVVSPVAMPAASTYATGAQHPLPPVPALPPATGAPLAPPVSTQALAPMAGMSAPQPVVPHGNFSQPASPQPAYATTQPAAPHQQPATVAASLVTPAATPDAPPSTIRDAQIYQEGSVAHGGGAGPAPAQLVAVTSVPPPSSGGPNLMAYALTATHPVGTEVYRRLNPLRWSRWESACLQFRNQDAAQIAFLANGGPERDRDNLDPDGDGYACWWDPTPFRQAVSSR
ncbi:MAG: hypothetical protein ACK4GT_06245 [Pararhodobacter sp.]